MECDIATNPRSLAQRQAAAPLCFAAALQGASRIFTYGGERKLMWIFARNGSLEVFLFLPQDSVRIDLRGPTCREIHA
jgi:hypothetical protein